MVAESASHAFMYSCLARATSGTDPPPEPRTTLAGGETTVTVSETWAAADLVLDLVALLETGPLEPDEGTPFAAPNFDFFLECDTSDQPLASPAAAVAVAALTKSTATGTTVTALSAPTAGAIDLTDRDFDLVTTVVDTNAASVLIFFFFIFATAVTALAPPTAVVAPTPPPTKADEVTAEVDKVALATAVTMPTRGASDPTLGAGQQYSLVAPTPPPTKADKVTAVVDKVAASDLGSFFLFFFFLLIESGPSDLVIGCFKCTVAEVSLLRPTSRLIHR